MFALLTVSFLFCGQPPGGEANATGSGADVRMNGDAARLKSGSTASSGTCSGAVGSSSLTAEEW